MKNIFRFILCTTALCSVAALASTEISGEIHGLLTIDKSPYIVTGNLTVEENNALFIQPGVTLLFNPGTALYVDRGQLTISGTTDDPVIFSPKDSASSTPWNGLYLTGDETFFLKGLIIDGSEVGIAMEQATLNLQSSIISNTTARGIFVRDGSLTAIGCEFNNNKGVGLHVSNYATANVDRTIFSKNKVGLLNSELANTIVTGSEFYENDYGVMGKENTMFYFHQSEIHNNKVGAAGIDILDPSVIESVSTNEKNFKATSIDYLATLPPNPSIPGIESRAIDPTDKIGTLTNKAYEKITSSPKNWSVIGNVMLGGTYHYVRTRSQHEGGHYENIFQVPGFGAEASVYLYMQSITGRTIELNVDLTSDSWNHFSPNPITLSYRDLFNNLTLGDILKTGGTLYMEELPIFGVDYTLALLKNNADAPLFEINGFFGEAKRSLVPGTRHPFMYKDYIEDGTAQAQRLAYGGSFKWAPVRRFDAKVGFIYANDELKDPLLRKGASETNATIDPMVQALTVYADGNWLFFPGDIELNGQIAAGHADTTDVYRERAVNKIFKEAGLNAASYTTLRKIMHNANVINTLSHDELIVIFGENTTMRDSQMKDSLRTLIRDAKDVQKTVEKERDDDRFLGLDWGSQNIALSASMNWNIYKTHIMGSIKYVGEDFYSAGSDDQLNDTRELNLRVEQQLLNSWFLGVEYQLNIENAAKDGKSNILGFGEGSTFGFFSGTTDNWYTKYSNDDDHTKYIHTLSTDHTFDINKFVRVTAGYKFQYQNQLRNTKLHGDYLLDDHIFKDKWFAARAGHSTSNVILDNDTTQVDSARWTDYNLMSGLDELASKFKERIYKHAIKAGISIKAFNTTFQLNGNWKFYIDGSEFMRDENIKGMDLHDTTWAKLGYYYGGANYFEQTYPFTATTSLKSIQNRFSFTPRFKSYKRDDMTETEFSISDNFEIGLMDGFFILGLNGEFRHMTTEWVNFNKNFDETEMDLLGDVDFRVNHTKHFYSDWNAGFANYIRPDQKSCEYKDIYAGVNLNYTF